MSAVGGETLGADWKGRIEPSWAPVEPLPKHPPVPGLPLEQLPSSFRDWIADAAERTQMPAEMIAVPAMVAAGSLIGRALAIQPKRNDTGWIEYANIWGVTIGPPGSMKSVGLDAGTGFLSAIATREREAYEAERPQRDAALQAIELELAHAKKKASSDKDGGLENLDNYTSAAVRN